MKIAIKQQAADISSDVPTIKQQANDYDDIPVDIPPPVPPRTYSVKSVSISQLICVSLKINICIHTYVCTSYVCTYIAISLEYWIGALSLFGLTV